MTCPRCRSHVNRAQRGYALSAYPRAQCVAEFRPPGGWNPSVPPRAYRDGWADGYLARHETEETR